MKKNFITGLAILLPVVFTILIIGFLIRILTGPFMYLTQEALHSVGFITNESFLRLGSQTLILIFLLGVTLLIGFLGSQFFVRYLFKWADHLLHRIPLVNKIYKALQDIVQSLFHSDKPSFSQVVLVPFPNARSKSIGLVTRHDLPEKTGTFSDVISVFVPGTPNPTMGFMLMYRRDQLVFLDITVEQAIKFVVSCGVILEK